MGNCLTAKRKWLLLDVPEEFARNPMGSESVILWIWSAPGAVLQGRVPSATTCWDDFNRWLVHSKLQVLTTRFELNNTHKHTIRLYLPLFTPVIDLLRFGMYQCARHVRNLARLTSWPPRNRRAKWGADTVRRSQPGPQIGWYTLWQTNTLLF